MTDDDQDGGRGASGPEAAQAHPTLLYRLLKLSNLIGRPFFTHFAERYDLTMNDLRVLMTLASMSEAASHELVRVIGIHPMNVSRSVARLRRHGRVLERSDPLNRRRKILTPTSEGWALYRKLAPHVTVLSQFLFGPLAGEEAEVLSSLLDRLIQRLESVDLNSPQLVDAQALARDLDVGALGEDRPRARPRRRRRGLSVPAPVDPRQ